MKRWNLILRVFISEYLSLQPRPDPIQRRHEYIERFNGELVGILSQ